TKGHLANDHQRAAKLRGVNAAGISTKRKEADNERRPCACTKGHLANDHQRAAKLRGVNAAGISTKRKEADNERRPCACTKGKKLTNI
ncbi:MAG: hypothetical protein PHG07_05375, partial [Lachnospiraceae bacterium]|nr:hypothetical protein [Lachnospiraceae bacterium]